MYRKALREQFLSLLSRPGRDVTTGTALGELPLPSVVFLRAETGARAVSSVGAARVLTPSCVPVKGVVSSSPP